MPPKKKKKYSAKNRKSKSPLNIIETLSRILNDEDLPEEMKMSHRVLKLIEPWHNTVSDITVLVDMACIAWNTCVDQNFSDKSVDFLTNRIVSYDDQSELIDGLKARKMKLFPNDYRTIIRSRIYYDETDNLELIIMSELKPENIGKMVMNFIENAKIQEDNK